MDGSYALRFKYESVFRELNGRHDKLESNFLILISVEPEAEFKEFEPRLKFKPRLKYG